MAQARKIAHWRVRRPGLWPERSVAAVSAAAARLMAAAFVAELGPLAAAQRRVAVPDLLAVARVQGPA